MRLKIIIVRHGIVRGERIWVDNVAGKGFVGFLHLQMLLLLLDLCSANCELMKNHIEFGLGVQNLMVKVAYDPTATAYGIFGTDIRLNNNGAHGGVLLRRVEVSDDLGDVANAKQFMSVEELLLAVVREIRSKNAVGSTLSSLVFTGSASLGGGGAVRSNSWDVDGCCFFSCCC